MATAPPHPGQGPQEGAAQPQVVVPRHTDAQHHCTGRHEGGQLCGGVCRHGALRMAEASSSGWHLGVNTVHVGERRTGGGCRQDSAVGRGGAALHLQ